MPKCRESEPALIEIEKKHFVRCFLYSEEVRENAFEKIIKSRKIRKIGRSLKIGQKRG